MKRYCLRCKLFGDEESFYPEAPQKALCRNCIKSKVRDRNKDVFSNAKNRAREQEALRSFMQQVQSENQSYIYLVEHENKYKVGFSHNVSKRLKSFNTSHAIPCKLIAVAPGNSQLESELHKQFAINHISGEWFLKKSSILNTFKNLDEVMVFLPGYIKQ